MSIANFTLTKIAGGSQPQALQGSATGVLGGLGNGLGGMGFFDAFLSSLVADADPNAPEQNPDGKQLLNTQIKGQAPAPSKGENPLALLQIALSKAVDANGNIILAEATDAPTLKDQLDTTTLLINHLKNALPETGDQAGLVNKIIEKLQAKSETLQADITLLETGAISMDTPIEDVPMPVLVALGLDPAQISEVTLKIEQIEKKLGRDITVEDLIAGVGGIIPPAPQATLVAKSSLDKTLTFTSTDANISADIDADVSGEKPMNDLAQKLNALTVGGDGAPDEAIDFAAIDTSTAPVSKDTKKASFTETLADAATDETTVTGDASNKAKSVAANETVQKQPHIAAKENPAVKTANAQADLTFSAGPSATETMDSIFKSYGLSVQSTQAFSATAQAANVVSTSASAGQAHPATAMVASALVKTAKTGDTQTMTIRLDPPELGNVSIRLQFGKDKSVKAHITVEKSDTYTMLQRDSFTLERALQSTGLDTKADSISFELAQDNGTFARQNNGEASGDKKHNNGNISSLSGETGTEIEMIQSSVTWQVDPSTGRVRYNIFA